tara:strand:+ start:457 stop:663 length:207 start_codon:yes stop_codon:yes gene_type:complete
VKKDHQKTSFSLDTKLDKNIELDKVKTTNVNILLNRVRLDKKKVLRKRIIFSTVLVSLVSSLAIYFIA